jgi:hypothetical protein
VVTVRVCTVYFFVFFLKNLQTVYTHYAKLPKYPSPPNFFTEQVLGERRSPGLSTITAEPHHQWGRHGPAPNPSLLPTAVHLGLHANPRPSSHVQSPDPFWPVDLVPAKRHQAHVPLLHIDGDFPQRRNLISLYLRPGPTSFTFPRTKSTVSPRRRMLAASRASLAAKSTAAPAASASAGSSASLSFSFYLVFKPDSPNYSIDNITISDLNLTAVVATATTTSVLTVSPEFDVTVRADNPNDKIGIYYQKDSSVEVYYSDVRLCNSVLPVFYQSLNNVTVFRTALKGSGIELTSTMKNSLVMEVRKRGRGVWSFFWGKHGG